ncbi:neurofilament heavy polypeptide-like [Rhodamnia argentea]|uniref:Neurofilament heavy polypeptide-like n=1 Tax=Rhodamnia argentea TaxID=178133 RepID=A0A8B8PY66_9MYRT|nr:neurofilament heavy polypeptide-like [Rhodamnia argentea]
MASVEVESVNTALPEEKTEETIKPEEEVVELPTRETLPEEPKEEKVTGAVVTTEAETPSEEAETRELTGEAKVVTQELNVVETEEETPKQVTVAEEAPKVGTETEPKSIVEETAKVVLESTVEKTPEEAEEPAVEEKKEEVSAAAVDVSVPEAEAENPREVVKEVEKPAVEAKDGGAVAAEKTE